MFSALTGLRPDPADRRAQIGTIKVPDPRVDFLAGVYSPKKVTYAEVTFIDFPPARDAQKRAVLDQEVVAALRDADALVEVVRGFPDLTGGAATSLEDITAFDSELVLADLAQVEKRAERCRKEKGKERELALLGRLQEHLEAREAAADSRSRARGAKRARGLRVPVAPAAAGGAQRPRVGRRGAAPGRDPRAVRAPPAATRWRSRRRSRPRSRSSTRATGRRSLPTSGSRESARDRFIRASYALLDLISFLTAGEDECRAWPIRRGTGARKAAGRIHSDIERGFIRAEVMAYDDFVQHPSEAKCSEAGKLRLEGKDYVVQDGDIVHFRFAV